MARFLLAKVMDQFSEKTRVYINSLGGDVHQSIAIYDVIKVMLPDVCTIAMGLAASGASLILAETRCKSNGYIDSESTLSTLSTY